MLCKIADLITDVPNAGDLVPRCRDYLYSGGRGADIVIRTDLFRPEVWPTLSENHMIYMESGSFFYAYLLNFNGLYLHSSAIEYDNRAFLFSGHSGIGKSTHTRLWQQILGNSAQIINDDKPALRRLEDRWYAYGTPWCGKDGINQNKKVPIAGICFLKQSTENKIRRLTPQEALPLVMAQTFHTFRKIQNLDKMLDLIEKLVREIPIFELENKPETDAAMLSCQAMSQAAKETRL